MINAPPTSWLEYIEQGGVLAILIVVIAALAYLYRQEQQKSDALQEARLTLQDERLADQKARNAENVEMNTKILETQHQTNMVIKDNVELLRRLGERVAPRD